MEDTKSKYMSKTFWGGAATCVFGLLTVFGSIAPADVQNMVPGLIETVLGLVTIYGRLTANAKLI